MSNKGLLMIVAVLLVGILAVVFVHVNQETLGDPVAGGIISAANNIGNTIE